MSVTTINALEKTSGPTGNVNELSRLWLNDENGLFLFCFRTFRNLVRFQGVEITGLEVLCKDITPGPTV